MKFSECTLDALAHCWQRLIFCLFTCCLEGRTGRWGIGSENHACSFVEKSTSHLKDPQSLGTRMTSCFVLFYFVFFFRSWFPSLEASSEHLSNFLPTLPDGFSTKHPFFQYCVTVAPICYLPPTARAVSHLFFPLTMLPSIATECFRVDG